MTEAGPSPPRAGRASAAERLALLSRLGQTLARPMHLDELFDAVYAHTAQVLDATIFMFGLFDAASQTVEVVGQMDRGERLSGGSFPLGSGFTSQVIRTREPRLIRNWSTEGPRIQVMYAHHQTDLPLPESSVTVPLLWNEQAVGVLSLQSYAPDAYDAEDLLTLQAVGGQMAMAIETIRRSRRLDAQLRRRVSELEAVLSGMTDALLIVDREGAVVRLNHAARELLAIDASTNSIVLGQTLDPALWSQWPAGPRAVAAVLQPMIEALREGQPLHDREVELHADGLRVLSFSGAPLLDAEGGPTGAVIVFRDVTSRREVERLKDEMLSIAGHDLRTPVTVIKGQAQLLHRRIQSGKSEPAAALAIVTAIEGQADRLWKLLNLLLDLSRVEAGRMELDLEPLDLVRLAKDVVETVRATTDRHQLTVRATDAVEGEWDEARLSQVLQNLVGNAVKYSPAGGEIAVEIMRDKQWATVRVVDQGVGLAPEERPHVFERFYRASGTRRLEGTGLGLYICQGIVNAHGGRIWAESAGIGTGSAFCFSVPRKPSVQ